MLNPALFERVAMVYGQREALGLEGEALRLVEEIYKDFQRAGAALDDGARARLKEINSALAKESAAFSDAVLSEVNASAIVVENEAELAGLSEDRRAALAQAADEAGWGRIVGSFPPQYHGTARRGGPNPSSPPGAAPESLGSSGSSRRGL